MGFNWIVIVICLCLLAYLLFQEIKRANKHWLIWRITAAIVMVFCLCFLAIPIRYQTENKQAKDELILITPGFDDDSIANTKAIKYYTNSSLAASLKGKATYIPDLSYHLSGHSSIKKIKVYGDGLAKDDLEKLGNYPLELHQSILPQGIVACNWLTEIVEDENVIIQGVYNNLAAKNLKLKLFGYGTVLDSTTILAKSSSKFSLQHQIKQKGKAVLQVIAFNGKDTMSKEFIPIQSVAKTPIKLLMLTSFPGFESKFVKKWLYENGYALAFRSEISKKKYSTDFLNRKAIDINLLSMPKLKGEDVLIIDQQAYETISSAERNAINSAVSQGLGLVILADETLPATPLLKQFGAKKSADEEKNTVLALANSLVKLQSLPINQQLFLSQRANQQNIFTNQKQKIIAAQQLYGLGKVAATTFQNSYEWVLLGKKKDYANYWTSLISAVARKKQPNILIARDALSPIAGEKLTFIITTTDANIPNIRFGNNTLIAKQNLAFPNVWEAKTWLTKEGWNAISVNQIPYSFYAFGEGNWKAVKSSTIQKANLAHTKKQNVDDSKTHEATVNTEKEVSKWYFVMGFMLAASFLWLEGKFKS